MHCKTTSLFNICLGAIIVFLLYTAVSADGSAANTPEASAVLDEKNSGVRKHTRYVRAKPVTRKPPLYPRSRAQKRQAGLVEVIFMVAKDGTVFEAFAQKSTHPDFEKAALNAVNDYIYSPALLDGMPVDSRNEIRIMFEMSGAKDAVHPKFYRLYRNVNIELAKEDVNVEKVAKNIARMNASDYLGFYALAHLAKLEVVFSEKYRSDRESLQAIERLLLFEGSLDKNAGFLPDELITNLKQKVIQLNLKFGKWGAAVADYYALKEENPEAAAVFDKAVDHILNLVETKQSFPIDFEVEQKGHLEIRLLGNRIAFIDVNGTLSHLKFRCSRKFAEIPFELDKSFDVPYEWGACYMQILGEPKTTAKLIQLFTEDPPFLQQH